MFVLTVKFSLFVIEHPRHWLGFDDSAIRQASSFSECLRCAKLLCCPTDHISASLLSLLFIPLFTVYLMLNADAATAISHDPGILKISSAVQNAPQKGGSYIIVLVSSPSPVWSKNHRSGEGPQRQVCHMYKRSDEISFFPPLYCSIISIKKAFQTANVTFILIVLQRRDSFTFRSKMESHSSTLPGIVLGYFENPLASLDHEVSDTCVGSSCVFTPACMEYLTT